MSVMAGIEQEFIEYMNGFMDHFDDLSEGAWDEVCKQGVQLYNTEYNRNIDPHFGWKYYLENGS